MLRRFLTNMSVDVEDEYFWIASVAHVIYWLRRDYFGLFPTTYGQCVY